MKTSVKAAKTPACSVLHGDLTQAYFHDCYQMALVNSDQTPLSLYLRAISMTPAWVNTLMRLRNRVVSLFGLKNLGLLSDIDPNRAPNSYAVGERIGIFTLLYQSESEVVLGDFDKHLRARISVCKTVADGQACVALTTFVQVNNTLGKIYLLFVVPVHKLIVPAMLSRLSIGQ
jgi:Protein of unknown function (DUF2867)